MYLTHHNYQYIYHIVSFQISSRDMLISRSLNIEKYLTIEQVEGVPGYLFFVDGEFRTVVQDPPTDMDSNALMINTKYKIENVGFMYDGDCVGMYYVIPSNTMP